MKKILIIGTFLLVACSNKEIKCPDCPACPTEKKVDSVQVLESGNILAANSVDRSDSLMKVIDSLRSKFFLVNYKMERVKYYLKICMHNPSQDKFLKGWINRAIN